VALERPLGEHQHAVFRNFEHASASLQQLHRRLGIRGANLGRQTGGPWFVVSNDAVANRDVHGACGEGDQRWET
jgi:hypothetical protein